VEDCGLPGERVYRSLDDVPDRGSYFSTMVVR
ncbi:MAG TPA: precorrin-2 C(20)-methyltransferase, partial [Collinsella aerofaciens]|nr:precorrin-2 C(20)-methyltransferase [Collinsella aerofaciens]